MQHRRLMLALVFLAILPILEIAYYLPRLPDPMAYHFGLYGQPNGWASRSSYMFFECGLSVFMAMLFLGIYYLVSRVPHSTVNMPNKEYWLAPERCERTWDLIRRQLLKYGVATLVFLAYINHQTLRLNLGRSGRLEYFWPGLIVFLAFVVVWTVRFFRCFPRPPSQPSAQ